MRILCPQVDQTNLLGEDGEPLAAIGQLAQAMHDDVFGALIDLKGPIASGTYASDLSSTSLRTDQRSGLTPHV